MSGLLRLAATLRIKEVIRRKDEILLMKNLLHALVLTLVAGTAATLSAASVCPMTSTTTTSCDFLITIGSTGNATITRVPGSMPFNSMITFGDGTSDPGGDGSLVGVINNYSEPLISFTLEGSGADAGIFDFSFNGICVYTQAAYCSTAQSGYEGPTTTFSDLRSTVLFETTEGNIAFAPTLLPGTSTYFSIEDSAADINANGGLTVSNLTYAPEPSTYALLIFGVATLFLLRHKLRATA